MVSQEELLIEINDQASKVFESSRSLLVDAQA